jgi:hypothetical protein
MLAVSISTRCWSASLERFYAGLLKLAALPDEELRALIGSVLVEAEGD